MLISPKQRMLNAYRGIFSDRLPVAPEFWMYYPAKVLGVDMIAFERDVPFWQALQVTFRKYGTEGWGVAFPDVYNPDTKTKQTIKKVGESTYRQSTLISFQGKQYHTTQVYTTIDPSWVEEHPVKAIRDLASWVDMMLSPAQVVDFARPIQAHQAVGEDYLLEFWTGVPFFDFMASGLGFEKALYYFMDEEDSTLLAYRQRYIETQLELVRQAVACTPFEAFTIGCSYSCSSLIGPQLWRRWDKPYIHAMAEELHRHGKLLHIHFHGNTLATTADFAEMNIDCVCPFERPPGGDIRGLEGLRKVRALLQERVTMNGNVHTVETLIRGKPEDVRREVVEIKTAFAGSPRVIIGTGDQVGKETPEENIYTMVAEAVG